MCSDLDRDKIAGVGLTAIPPDAFRDVLVAGELNMRVATLLQGKELRVSIFESTPAQTRHRKRPTDVDEFVYVLSGKLILTETNGTKHEYRAGDSPVLPVGNTGHMGTTGNWWLRGKRALAWWALLAEPQSLCSGPAPPSATSLAISALIPSSARPA